MSQARNFADLLASGTVLSDTKLPTITSDKLDDNAIHGNRNLIINGAMQVAQRGTSFTAGGYSLDHWYVSEAGTCTLTQDTADVPTNFKYAAKVVTSAGSSFMSLYQPFESVDYEAFKNKTVTISFYAKVNSTFSGLMFVDMQTGDTADTLLSGTWAGNDPQFITPTTSWARYTASIAVGSTNGIRFVISPTAAQASGAEYSITGVQLEVGEQATPFEHRSYGDELARCQRYFCKADKGLIGTATNSGNIVFTTDFPVEMRATASISLTNTSARVGDMVSVGHTMTSCTVGVGGYASPRNYVFSLSGTTSPGLSTYRTYLHEPNGSYPAAFEFDAEL